MVVLKFFLRSLLFIIVILIFTYLLKYIILKLYIKMLVLYTLPKLNYDLTIISFLISFGFFGALSLNANYWKIGKKTSL